LSEEGGRKESILRRRKSTDVDSEREEGAMSFLKRNERRRHMGRRVAGVGVAVALMVLGLEAPAFAVAPTITSFTPTSGPAGCVMVITGTNFENPAVTAVDIGGDAVANFAVISDTEIWAESDAVASGTVHVTNGSGTANSAVNFTVADPGDCAPTVTGFTPVCGGTGTTVTITGTNLLSDSDPTNDETQVRFVQAASGTYTDDAVHTIPNAETPTTLSVLVPSGQTDGPIRVTTDVDVDFAPTPYQVPPPDCVPVTGNQHARSISFKITKAGRASGVVKSTEETPFTDCVAAVPVKIQRKKGGAWKTVGKTVTDDAGAYVKKVKNPKGTQKFRALAPKVSLGDPVTDVCLKARSAVRKK
jgi:hypothetical protein